MQIKNVFLAVISLLPFALVQAQYGYGGREIYARELLDELTPRELAHLRRRALMKQESSLFARDSGDEDNFQ
jgi:hypothetical protein